MKLALTCSPQQIVGTLLKSDVGGAHARVIVDLNPLSRRGVFAGLSAEKPWICGDAHTFRAALFSVIQGLASPEERANISAIELGFTRRSLLLIGRENRVLSDILWWDAEGVPPEDTLFSSLEEDVRGALRRPVSVGAWVVRTLTREWIEVFDRAPLGLPLDDVHCDYDKDPTWWDRMGVRRTYSPLLIPSGSILAQVTTDFARTLGVPAFTPIYGVIPSAREAAP